MGLVWVHGSCFPPCSCTHIAEAGWDLQLKHDHNPALHIMTDMLTTYPGAAVQDANCAMQHLHHRYQRHPGWGPGHCLAV